MSFPRESQYLSNEMQATENQQGRSGRKRGRWKNSGAGKLRGKDFKRRGQQSWQRQQQQQQLGFFSSVPSLEDLTWENKRKTKRFYKGNKKQKQGRQNVGAPVVLGHYPSWCHLGPTLLWIPPAFMPPPPHPPPPIGSQQRQQPSRSWHPEGRRNGPPSLTPGPHAKFLLAGMWVRASKLHSALPCPRGPAFAALACRHW
jgi:hypothetical protein